LPVLLAGALMISAFGLVLSVYIRQLENFAGTMNFVIFPMFFLSSALYPIQRMHDAGAEWIYRVAMFNPFTHAVEAMRHALYGELAVLSLSVVIISAIVFYLIAAAGYDPQRGLVRNARGG
jgi:ABC-2 type transport system permease protein